MAVADIKINGQIYRVINPDSEGTPIYQNLKTGVKLSFNSATNKFESNINIPKARLDEIDIIDNNRNNLHRITIDANNSVNVIQDPANPENYYRISSDGQTVTRYTFVPADPANNVDAHYTVTINGQAQPATSNIAIVPTTATIDPAVGVDNTFTLEQYPGKVFRRVNNADRYESIGSDDKVILDINVGSGDYTDNNNNVVRGFDVIKAASNGDGSILFGDKYITPVTANGITTYYDDQGNAVLVNTQADPENFSGSLGTTTRAHLNAISSNTRAFGSGLRIDPNYTYDENNNATLVSFNITDANGDVQTVPVDENGNIVSTDNFTAEDAIKASMQAEQNEDVQQQIDLDDAAANWIKSPIGLVVGVLSAGVISIGAGVLNYLSLKKNHAKRINEIVQDAYEEQLQADQEPDKNKLSLDAKVKIQKAEEDFQAQSAKTTAFAGAFTAVGIAAFLTATLVTGGLAAIIAGFASGAVAALVGGVAGYYAGQAIAKNTAEDIFNEAVTNPDNKLGNQPRKEMEQDRAVKNIDQRLERQAADIMAAREAKIHKEQERQQKEQERQQKEVTKQAEREERAQQRHNEVLRRHHERKQKLHGKKVTQNNDQEFEFGATIAELPEEEEKRPFSFLERYRQDKAQQANDKDKNPSL